MRKASIIAMAALALLTAQCKKNEPKPEEKVMVPITGSVDFGGGSKTEITTTGMIYPKDDDVIYIYDNGTNVGSMTCTAQSGSQQFTCSGTIQQTSLEHTCTFMYLGSNNGVDGESDDEIEISFANQTEVKVIDGKISGLEKFHVGSCQAQVSTDGKVTLPMATKMSIAYFELTDGTNPIANTPVTISGVYATANIDKTNGTLTNGVTGNITVKTDAEGKFYMALIPQSGPVTFNFAVEGYENATNVFPNGIRECSFYSNEGSGNPLQVTVQKPAYIPANFSVAADKQVKFSRGNLYYDNGWHFEKNQYDFRTLNTNARCIDGVYGASSGTDVGRGIFGWSTDGTGCNWGMYSSTDIDGDFVEWGQNSIDGETGYRTLSRGDDPKGEWDYLMTERTGKYNNTDVDAAGLFGYGTITVSGGSVKGLVLLPDTFVLPERASFYSSSTLGFTANQYTTEQWSKMEEAGAVFLPHTGYYNKDFGGSYQSSQTRYWSSTKDNYIYEYNPNYRYAKNLLINESSYSPITSISLGLARVCNFYAVRLVVDVPPTESDGNGAPDYTQGTW